MPLNLPALKSPLQPEIAQIGEAAGAYPGQVQQYQENQAQVDSANLQDYIQKMQVLGPLLDARSDYRSNSQVIAALQGLSKRAGIPLPMQGNSIDTTALGLQAPWQKLLSDQSTYTYAMALSPQDRTNYFLAHGVDPSTIPDSILKAAPSQVTSPTEASSLFSKAMTEISELGKGTGDVNNIQAEIKTFGPIIDRIAGPGASASLANSLSSAIGPYVQAKINQALMSGELNAAKIPEIQAAIHKMNAETNLDKKKAEAQQIIDEYAPELESSKIAANYARVVEANAAMATASAHIRQVQLNVDQTTKFAPGSKEWTAALTAIKSDLPSVQKAYTDAQAKVDALGNIQNPSPQNQADLAAAQTAAATAKARLDQLNTSYDSLLTKAGVGDLSHGPVVESRTTADGRTLNKYADGTIEYAP